MAVIPIEIVECGACGQFHRADYFGECRDDAKRFNSPEDAANRIGLPVVVLWLSIDYECPNCGHEWSEEWSCACDSTCPECEERDCQAVTWTDISEPAINPD